jgi:hypothetical protein
MKNWRSFRLRSWFCATSPYLLPFSNSRYVVDRMKNRQQCFVTRITREMDASVLLSYLFANPSASSYMRCIFGRIAPYR